MLRNSGKAWTTEQKPVIDNENNRGLSPITPNYRAGYPVILRISL